MENIENIIHKSRIWADKLKLGITIQNKLTQDGFDTNGIEFSKALEGLENRLLSLDKKLQNAQEEVSETKENVAKLSEELTEITNENSSLTRTQSALLSLIEPTKNERSKKAKLLQEKLKAYKAITGVRFQFADEVDEKLSGYIAISGDKPCESSIVPFNIDKNKPECSQLLWQKVEEACTEVF